MFTKVSMVIVGVFPLCLLILLTKWSTKKKSKYYKKKK